LTLQAQFSAFAREKGSQCCRGRCDITNHKEIPHGDLAKLAKLAVECDMSVISGEL